MNSLTNILTLMSTLFSICYAENVLIGAALTSREKGTVIKDYLKHITAKVGKKDDLIFDYTVIELFNNPIRSAMSICDDLVEKKVHVIIASHPPHSPEQSPISVSYTTGYYGIPLIGLTARDSSFSDKNVHSTFMRTVPPYFHQAYVWIDILKYYKWKQVIFIHGMDEEGRSILSQFQSLATEAEITIEKIVKYSVGIEDFTELLQDLNSCQSRIILLSAEKEDATFLFDNATTLNLTVRSDFVWLVTQEALQADNVPDGVVGMELANGTKEDPHIMDSLKVIVTAFTNLSNEGNLNLDDTPSSCKNQSYQPWQGGQTILQTMKDIFIEGETGQIAFTEEGDRLHPTYYIRNVQNGVKGSVGFHKKLRENNNNVLNIAQPIIWPDGGTDPPKGIKISKVLEVVTISAKPFVYTEVIENEEDQHKCIEEKNGDICVYRNTTTETDIFHCCWGYCIEMLKHLAERVNFTYNIHLSMDESFGSFKRIGNSSQREWTGMVGELVNEQADLAVAPLTINPERAQVIDFTKPFKYQGLTILVKKTQKDSSLASFLQPFQDTLWILVGLSVHVVALVLYLLDRFSPFGRFKLAKNEDTEEDALNLSSAMWFAWGVLLNSGIGEGTPRSFSARVLGMVWAGFAMIIVASYTANLAAFLVLDRPDASISGIDDSRLRNPNENFHYATVKDSAVEMYFKRQVELSTMYRKMEELNYKYKTAEEAIAAVKKGQLQAFIWDSSRLEYEDAKDCDLVTAGELFGRSGLGVGLRKGSPWTHEISLKILELHEGGQMENLDNDWILIESPDCPERDHTPATLGLTNMAGVFMMVAGGIVAGVFLIVVEILYKRHRGVKEKELELARNAADRWRGNIAKRRTLRQTMQNQREEQNRMNSLAKMSSIDSNSTMATPISRATIKQSGSGSMAGQSPPILKPKVTLQSGRIVAPSASTKRRTLRQTMQNQREEQNRMNSLAKMSSIDSNSTMATPISRATIKQSGSGSMAGQSPPILKPKVTLQSGRIVAPSASTVMVSNPAFSTANRSDFV